MFGSVYLQTNAMKHGYTAYKDMYMKGQDACTMRFNNFTEYYADQKTTPMDPKLGLQAAGMCNASPLSSEYRLGKINSIFLSFENFNNSFSISAVDLVPKSWRFEIIPF